MRSTWQKLVYMWNTHKRRFICAVFCLALVLGAGSQVAPAAAQDCNGDGIEEPDECISSSGGATAQNPGRSTGSPSSDVVPPAGSDLYDMALTLMARAFDAVFEAAFKLVSVLIAVLISIVSYDTFSDNAAIKVGWPIVRNAINMFVILGLLFIAIKNLVPGQGDNARTQGQLFKVLLAVVLMNFSQTIALLAVDLSQVVTITFAQAISDIGAGNFIQLFGLQNYLTLAPDANDSVSASGSQGAILLGTVLFKLVMLGAVALAILVMIVAFVVRIVLLWFLIIVSPAAFFAFGLNGALPMADGVWKQWSDQFMGLLVFGPVLTFFLWLSLAIAAGGDMASTLDFEVDPSLPSAGLLASAQPASILSTVIAVIMIFIGIGVSAQVASSSMGVGAIMSKGSDLTRGFIKRGAKMAAYGTGIAATGGLGAGIAAAGAGAVGLGSAAGLAALAGGGAAGYGATTLRSDAAIERYQGAARGVTRLGGRLERSGVPLVSSLGRGLMAVGNQGALATGGVLDERRRDAKKTFDAYDDETKNQVYQASGRTGRFATVESRAVYEEGARQLAVSKSEKARLRKSVAQGGLGRPAADRLITEALYQGRDADNPLGNPDRFAYIEDAKAREKAEEDLRKAQIQNLDLIANDDDPLNAAARRKLFAHKDFAADLRGASSETRAAVLDRSTPANAARADRLQAEMDTHVVTGKVDRNGNPVSMMAHIRNGGVGSEWRTAAAAATPPPPAAPVVVPVAENGALNPAAVNVTPDQIREAVATRQLEMQNINDQVLNQYQDAVVGAVIGSAAALNLDALPDASRNRINMEVTRQQAALENRIQREQGGIAAPDQATELTNLRRARFGLSRQGGNLRASGSEAVYVQPGNTGAFQSPELRTEFTNELRRDFTSVRHVATQAVQGDLAQEMQQIFDTRQAAIQQEAIRAMRAQDQAAIANIRESLGKYRAAITNSPALSADPAGQRTRIGTIRRLEGVLSATPSGPPPAPQPAPAPAPAPGPRPRRGRRRGPRGGGGAGGGGTP